ncbi:MAG: phosphopentomutase [Pseudomonadota bacterium]
MSNFNRVCVIVLDSVGVGELPDAEKYGDVGSNTLGNIAKVTGGLSLPNLQKMGLGNIIDVLGVDKCEKPIASWGKMDEASPGKDTTTGHWEMAGIILDKPFVTYENCFPQDLIDRFEAEAGYKSIGHCPESGTEIIKRLGNQHYETGELIVYTSADSVFQIAAHEEKVPIDELYRICEIARKICDEYSIGRVIARPFVGEPGNFTRTANRKDFSVTPPADTMLTLAQKAGHKVVGIGKTDYIFDFQGTTDSFHGATNAENVESTIKALQEFKEGLIFTNLVDFDMLWGHRNDPEGYKKGLEEFDVLLPKILDLITDDTLLFITADHGCDPTTASTDHSREYVPILMYNPKMIPGTDLGIRETFADLAKTVCEVLKLDDLKVGKSFL